MCRREWPPWQEVGYSSVEGLGAAVLRTPVSFPPQSPLLSSLLALSLH